MHIAQTIHVCNLTMNCKWPLHIYVRIRWITLAPNTYLCHSASVVYCDFSSRYSEKGKPAERQGRKVSDLRGKPMIAGPPMLYLAAPLVYTNKEDSCHLSSQFQKLTRQNLLLCITRPANYRAIRLQALPLPKPKNCVQDTKHVAQPRMDKSRRPTDNKNELLQSA